MLRNITMNRRDFHLEHLQVNESILLDAPIKDLEGEEGKIVTLIFITFNTYQSVLTLWLLRSVGSEFTFALFYALKANPLRNRGGHIRGMKRRKNELYLSMIMKDER